MSAVAAPIIPTATLSYRLRPAIEIGQCVVLEDVSWQAYELIGEALRSARTSGFPTIAAG